MTTTRTITTSRDYEGLFVRWEELYKRAHTGKLHIKKTDVPVVDSRQGTSQFYIMPQFEELALTQWVVFLRDHTGVPSGRHRHQGGCRLPPWRQDPDFRGRTEPEARVIGRMAQDDDATGPQLPRPLDTCP